MLDYYPHLKVRDDDTKRLRQEFGGDERLYFARNAITHHLEAWYKPDNSRPYKIVTADNVCHAIVLCQSRLMFDKMRAKDILKSIDEHNQNRSEKGDEDAVHEVRNQMTDIMKGRKYFLPSRVKVPRSA